MSGDSCAGIGPIIGLIKNGIYPIIQIGIPILLVVMGSIDLGKAVVANDDKEVKAATSRLIKKAIAAVAVFLLTTVVYLLLNIVAKNTTGEGASVDGTSDWWSCWETA